MSETYEETLGDNCKYCLAPIAVRNPTGKCDHLCWPDHLTDEAKLANGISVDADEDVLIKHYTAALEAQHVELMRLVAESDRLRTLIDGLIKAVEPFAMVAPTLTPPLSDDDIAVAPVEVTYGDLRRAREAYLKAKGE